MKTEIIPTKFPEADVNFMDKLIRNGIFISRSDLIREGARRLIQEKILKMEESNKYILEMENKGDFKNIELIVLANLFINKKLTEKEEIVAKRLTRNPLKPIKIIEGKFVLTEIGIDLAEGFLDSLLHLRKIKNVK